MRYRLEFDWPGTIDPTPALTLPAAIDWVARLEVAGWPAVMAANHALALSARDRLSAALGVLPAAPNAMIGSMVSVPIQGLTTDADAARLHDALAREDRIEIPFIGWPVRGARRRLDDPPDRVLIRASTQRYNEPADIDRLVSALGRRLSAA